MSSDSDRPPSSAGKTPRRALGRGLDALLAPAQGNTWRGATPGLAGSVFTCPIERIVPQPDQPRQHLDEERLDALATSIRQYGLLEPILVRRLHQEGGPRDAERYEIIAGERRWRASQKAGQKEVLVVVKDVSSDEAFELALVENLEREDLNPIEVAEAYDRLLRDHGFTQQKLADRMGRSRAAVTNVLRLLKLPVQVRAMVNDGRLTEGHARALLGATDPEAMSQIATKVARGRLSVRKTEELARNSRAPAGESQAPGGGGKGNDKGTGGASGLKSAAIRDLELRLVRKLGARTTVEHAGPGGKLVIGYADLDELDRILAVLGVADA